MLLAFRPILPPFYDEALAVLDAAPPAADDDEPSQAATVLAYIRELAEAGDDGAHSVAEAFASEQ